MKKTTIICDECKKAEVKDGGYLINHAITRRGVLTTTIAAYGDVDSDAFASAICGKECLIKFQNGLADRIGIVNVPEFAKHPAWEANHEAA